MEFKNFQKNRTTTECKGTRALLLLLPPTTGVWNDMVCVISSPSIVTPLFLLIREKKLVRTSCTRLDTDTKINAVGGEE